MPSSRALCSLRLLEHVEHGVILFLDLYKICMARRISQHDVDLPEGEKVLHRTCPPQPRPPLAYRVETSWFERVVPRRTVSVGQRGWTSSQIFDEAGPERLGGRGVCSSGRLAKAT